MSITLEFTLTAITWIFYFLQTVFQNPSVKGLIERTDRHKEKLFDVVFVCCALYGEEPGYYLAHRVSQRRLLVY